MSRTIRAVAAGSHSHLRDSAATLLLAQGVSARVVMDLIGHSTIGMTLGTYSHVLPDMQREAADRMDAVLGG